MKAQTKTKEERFEKVVEYKESREEYFGDIFGFIILAPFIMLMEFFDKLSDYIKDNRKVYWRRIKD